MKKLILLLALVFMVSGCEGEEKFDKAELLSQSKEDVYKYVAKTSKSTNEIMTKLNIYNEATRGSLEERGHRRVGDVCVLGGRVCRIGRIICASLHNAYELDALFYEQPENGKGNYVPYDEPIINVTDCHGSPHLEDWVYNPTKRDLKACLKYGFINKETYKRQLRELSQ